MTIAELQALRLYNQKIVGSTATSPQEVVSWLGAMQAQDFQASLHAVGLRIPGATEPAIERALDERAIVRGWLMRATIHLMPAADALWMTKLLSPRQNKKAASIYRGLNLTENEFAKARLVLEKVLVDGPKMRSDIYTAFEAAGVKANESRGMQLIKYWGQEGVLCMGPRRGKQQTFALMETWVDHNKISGDEEGFSILAERYFKSHGPATLKDFMWWTGATKTEVTKAIDSVRSQFSTEVIEGQEYLFSADKVPSVLDKKEALLLPAFDEYTVAYADRTAVMTTEEIKKTFYGISPNIIVDGRAIGTWKRTFKSKEVQIQLAPFNNIPSDVYQAIEKSAETYGQFVGYKAVLLP